MRTDSNTAIISTERPSSPVLVDVLSKKPAQSKAFVLALVANLLWGTSFLASKNTLHAWGPFTASALRFALALVFLLIALPFFRFRIRLLNSKREFAGISLIALSGFGLLYPLQLTGLKFISSGLSAAIMLTSPIFVVVFGRLFLSEPISQRKMIALFLGITGGCILLFGTSTLGAMASPNIIYGSLLTLGASASLAASVAITRKVALKLDAANITFWSMLGGLLMLIPFAIHESDGNLLLAADPSALISLLYLALVCSAACFLMWNAALAIASAKDIASTMHVKTPAAVALGIVIAGEQWTSQLLAGCLIVAFGVWLSQRPEVQK
jgi:drug/metabolite transporter (DMT)-like permease